MQSITVTAKTYDEAITEAIQELQTSSDHLDVTVVEEGKDGLLGVIGGKPWVIRAMALTDEQLQEKIRKQAELKNQPKEEKAETEEAPVRKINTIIMEEVAPVIEETVVEDFEIEVPEVGFQKPERDLKPVSEEEAAELTEKAVVFLKDTFKVMDMDVQIQTSFDHEENELNIVLSGEDMGMLIGKRGQTLDSFQYLTSLVVNKHHDGYIRVKLDTENYRERRQVKLEELAHNIAHKVSRTKKAVDLEPMNPYERRIIHSALQDDPFVTTVSEGEEPYRHVVVMLKKSNRRHR
ncbi:MAG: protein jag [Lachnospiraceae bacterium]|nr:protein jag [Candidatus Darwinimomas equi]